ncbi:MAG: hypothetical protein Q9165_008124 [Trypethelium subeluteriae]
MSSSPHKFNGNAEELIDKLVYRSKECEQLGMLDNQKFIPADSITQIVTEENVRQAVDASSLVEHGLTEFILHEARAIFLILCRLNRLPAIIKLKAFGLTDEHLPIVIDLGQSGKTSAETRDSLPQNQFSSVRESLGLGLFAQFQDEQWKFLAPVFTDTDHGHTFHENHILPFTYKGAQELGGGFSTVYKIKIHAAHFATQREENKGQKFWALKESKLASDHATEEEVSKMYKHEAKALQRIRALRDKHFIDVIAMFQRANKWYFIFPWADRGNLRDFWDQQEREVGTKSAVKMVEWALHQLHGLSSALSLLYEQGGRHGDLKPENILLFDDYPPYGRLVIADVGLTKFHSKNTALRSQGTGTMTGTRRYEPPDVLYEVPRSRGYDIWSMGCICLEFVVWLLWGKEVLGKFNKSFDKFWNVDDQTSREGEVGVDAKVIKAMGWMTGKDPRCGKETALGNLLILVHERLLVVDVHFRAGAAEFCNGLHQICESFDEPDYVERCVQPQDNLCFLGGGKSGATNKRPRISASSLYVPGASGAADSDRRLRAESPGSNPYVEFEIAVGRSFHALANPLVRLVSAYGLGRDLMKETRITKKIPKTKETAIVE